MYFKVHVNYYVQHSARAFYIKDYYDKTQDIVKTDIKNSSNEIFIW